MFRGVKLFPVVATIRKAHTCLLWCRRMFVPSITTLGYMIYSQFWLGYSNGTYIAYVNDHEQRCRHSPHTPNQLYEGLSTGFLLQDLAIYALVGGKIVSHVTFHNGILLSCSPCQTNQSRIIQWLVMIKWCLWCFWMDDMHFYICFSPTVQALV